MLVGKGADSPARCDTTISSSSAAAAPASMRRASPPRLGGRSPIVDGAKALGGLCILRGCMPSKTLLYSAEVLHHAQQGRVFGLKIPRAAADMKAVQARKQRIIGDFARYRVRQLTAGDFDLYRQPGALRRRRTRWRWRTARGCAATRFLIATGSKVSVPPVPGLADVPFWTSDDVLDLDCVPEVRARARRRHRGLRARAIPAADRLARGHDPAQPASPARPFARGGRRRAAGVPRRGDRACSPAHRSGRSPTAAAASRWPSSRAAGGDPPGPPPAERPRPRTQHRRPRPRRRRREARPGAASLVNRWQQPSQPHIYAAGDCLRPA